jgi:tetratricopeptide (TPR) repeat protein
MTTEIDNANRVEALRTLIEIANDRKARGKSPDGPWFSVNEIEAMYKVGHDLFEQAQWRKAQTIFSMLRMFDATDTRFPLAEGICHKLLKQYGNALRSFARLVELMPGSDIDDPKLVMNVAECLIGLGDKAQALAVLKQALSRKRAPGNDAGLWQRALQWYSMMIKGVA